MAIDALRPIIILKKSFATKGNTPLNLRLSVNVALASSRPVSNPTTPPLVLIGMSFNSLKKYSINQ